MATEGEAHMTAGFEKNRTLKDILLVENDRQVLDIRCEHTGIPLWTTIRVPFIRMIMSDMLYDTPIVGDAAPVHKLQAVRSLTKAWGQNASLIRQNPRADILLMSHGMGNQRKGALWFNRLSDYFALARPAQTLTIEDFFNWQWPFPRHNRKTLLHAPIQVAGVVAGKISCRDQHRVAARHLVALVERRAYEILGWTSGEVRSDWLVNSLARKYAAMPYLYRRYQALLSRIEPKILIKEEACYGPSAVLIRAARDMGIITAEYQHGSISAGHDAYNFAESVCNDSAYRNTLPEYFLSYGKWWEKQVNFPLKKISIGNPHRHAKLQEYIDYPRQCRDSVLILGDGIETDLYVQLTRDLSVRLGTQLGIVFRPHPMEKSAVLAQFPGGAIDSARIDTNSDIYQSFLSARAVVSEVSTGLFEAVGLVENIFVWDTEKARFCYPEHPFNVFTDAADLAESLASVNQNNLRKIDEAGIWQPGWSENYNHFLDGIGLKAN